MDQEKIGKFIADLRKQKNITQAELGNLLGVSNKSVSKWENGICLPDPSLYNELCKIFNISKDELFNGKRKIKNYKKRLIIAVIIILSFIMIYQLFKVRVYKLEIENKNELVAHGTLMDSFFKDNFYLKINLNNPDDIRAIGLYIKYEDNYYIYQGTGFNNEPNNTQFIEKLEKGFYRGNYINELIKNKDNVYICIKKTTDKNWDGTDQNRFEMIDDNCYRLKLEKYD